MTNTTSKNVISGKEAIDGMMRGVTIAYETVAPTMGAKGSNIVIEQDLYPYHIITNDGATGIEHLQLTDPLEKRGLAFIKEATDRSNRNSGDGSTTTVVLLHAILKEGLKQDKPTIEIKRSLDELLPIIEQKIDEQKKKIDIGDIRAVAKISGESDELATVLTEIYDHIGTKGIVHLEGSGTDKTFYGFVDGVRFTNTGYLSPFMVHDDEARKSELKETKAIYEKPTILVTKRKITSMREIEPLFLTLESQGKKDLIIFTDDMESSVASTMIETHKVGVFNVCIIKAPVLWKGYVFEDFAKVVGATIVEDATGLNFNNLALDHLGTCDKIIVTKDDTIVMGGTDISEHLADLKAQDTEDSRLRLSWLVTKTAVLKLGANSESELSYLRLKAEDAINACKLALEDGVVPGGGLALYNVSREMPDTLAGNILKKALKAPIQQIIDNAGGLPLMYYASSKEILEDVGEKMKKGEPILIPHDGTLETISQTIDSGTIGGETGFDANKQEFANMWEAGIIDAAKVTKMAVRNAIGLASTILTTNTVIWTPERPDATLKDREVKF